MHKKSYVAPSYRFVPLRYLEEVCTNASGSIPGYDPIDDYEWE